MLERRQCRVDIDEPCERCRPASEIGLDGDAKLALTRDQEVDGAIQSLDTGARVDPALGLERCALRLEQLLRIAWHGTPG
jgi:hypothetical protein